MNLTKNKKVLFGLGALVVVAGLILTLLNQNTTPAGEKPTVKIGVAVPLTKDYAVLGEPMQNAIILAKEQLGDKTKYNYELIFEDTQLDPQVAATVAQKLINVDQVDAIISFNSGVGNIISPLAEENQIIHLGIASDMAVAEGDYNFIHWTPPSEEAKRFVEELQKRNITRLAILSTNTQAQTVIDEAIKAEISGTNIQLVSEQVFSPEETDFKTMLLKSEQESPEIICLMVGTVQLELIAKQMTELGIETPVTSIENIEFAKDPTMFEGCWYIQTADASSTFKNQYVERFASDPNVGTANAYDNFKLIVEAFESAKASRGSLPTIDEAVKKLAAIKDFEGAMGSLTMSPEGIVLSRAIVREVRNGEFVTIDDSQSN